MLEKDQLDSLIEILTEARRIGFSSLSSPIGPLLDLMVDSCLLLANKLLEVTAIKIRNNPILKEVNDEIDANNNPLIIKLRSVTSILTHHDLPNFFRSLAQELIQVKDKDYYLPFMGRKVSKIQNLKKLSGESFHYFRRTLKRRNLTTK